MEDPTAKRMNYGCGRDYRTGWMNVEMNRSVKADIYVNPQDTTLPFSDDSFVEILLDNVLEHLPKDKLFPFLDEIYRVSCPHAVVRVYVPHFTSVFAYANLSHQSAFAIGAFDCCEPGGMFNTSERYGKATFHVRRQRLFFFGHNPTRMPILARLPIDWLFNGGWVWQKFMERFQFAGFDEVYFELEVVKLGQDSDGDRPRN